MDEPDVAPGCVQHLFARGLRFTTELEYRVRDGNGKSGYRRLLREPSPYVRHRLDRDGQWTCASLAIAVLTQSPIKPPGLDMIANTDPNAITEALTRQLPRWQVDVHDAPGLAGWGDAACEALRLGGLALVELLWYSQPRWALVVGTEWCSGAEPPMQHRPALLLVDVSLDPVWGCGHNARFTLSTRNPGSPLKLSTLHGSSLSTQPGRLVVLRPSALS
jgi:hypothetical protein